MSGRRNQSGKSNGDGSNNNNNGPTPSTNYSIAQSYGGMHQFMASYGIQRTPEGYQEANAILNEFRKADCQNAQQNQQSGNRHK